MATYFKNILQSEIGTSEELIYTTGGNTRATFIGLSLTNLTSGIVLASVRLEQLDTAIPTPNVTGSAYYIKDIIVPPNQSLRVVNGGEKLVLGTSMKVYVQASEDASIDLVASYVEIV